MPIPSPNKGESQDDFMSRCMTFMHDEGGRPQEQQVAICLSTFRKGTQAMATKNILAFAAGVDIVAGDADKKTPAKFDSVFYTGGALDIDGWDLPVVVDLSGVTPANILVANLDHEASQRVGNFDVTNDGKSLTAHGTATAATRARDEVVASASEGYKWQASIEAKTNQTELVKAGKMVTVNGQSIKGPIYVVRRSTLKGFAFVSHGADDNTTASIAATAANSLRSHPMKLSAKASEWIKAVLPTFDLEAASDEDIERLQNDFDGRPNAPRKSTVTLGDRLKAQDDEQARVDSISQTIDLIYGRSPNNREQIKRIGERAIAEKWTDQQLRAELFEGLIPIASANFNSRPGRNVTARVIEAAICMTGRLVALEKSFDAQTLEIAAEKFKSGMGLKQLWCLAAESNGFRAGFDVDLDVHRAAFGMINGAAGRYVQAEGFATLSLPNILSNVANKFLMEGWLSIDQTPLRVGKVRPVRDFKQTTTVSLTGGLMFKKIGPDGELKSAELGETVYLNQADTYGIICQITRTDIINDDLNALTAVPTRIGRGGMLKLNDLFWSTFLNNSSFFTSGNKNVNTGAGSALSFAGLSAAEVVFMNQQDPDGNPLGIMPSTLLVGPTNKTTALQLMQSTTLIGSINTSTGAVSPSTNVFTGRYNVEASPYMENVNYTGYSTTAWYLLAPSNILPVIEIAALNGKPEPTVQTADAEFSNLGVSMRGYSDVGVALQEFRGGVRSAGA
jgi:hypothetical protein